MRAGMRIVSIVLAIVLGCGTVYGRERIDLEVPNTLIALGLENIDDVRGKRLPEVVVAVIDTGLDMDSFSTYFSENRILESSINLLTGETGKYAVMDGTTGHGSAVAAIIAKGTPSNVKLMIIKASDNGTFDNNTVIDGIEYAIDNGADIINISVGGALSYDLVEAKSMPEVCEVFEKAERMGVPIICSAGNDGKEFSESDEHVYFPAGLDYDNIIGVGSISEEGTRSSFSNYGYLVDFSAVGENVRTLYYSRAVSGNSTVVWSCGTAFSYGTSLAAPAITSVYAIAATEFLRDGGRQGESFSDSLTSIVKGCTDSTGVTNASGLVREIDHMHKFLPGFKNGKRTMVCEKCGKEKVEW